MKSFIAECKNRNIVCGIAANEGDWKNFSRGNRYYCPELNVLPLFYYNAKDCNSFSPMGGWQNYNLCLPNTSESYCQYYKGNVCPVYMRK